MVKKLMVLLFFIGLLLPVTSQAVPGFLLMRMGSMSGQVVVEGKPQANALLAFFDVNKGLPPIAGQGGRTPDLRVSSDQDGKFTVKLLQGAYYLGVLLRGHEEGLGPPRKGEIFYFADGGEGKLRRLPIEDYKSVDHGIINCSEPGIFTETEETFTVTGVVVKGAGEEEPFPGAVVLAKSKESTYRPEYISRNTGEDGKFSILLPAGKSFTLIARTAITGAKPQPGENIGKYGANSFEAQVATLSQLAPPPGVNDVKPARVGADEAISISGASGQVLSGLIIHMFKMPDQQAIQEEKRNTAGGPDYTQGAPLQNLFFATNSAQLQGDFAAELDQWVKFLQDRPDIMIDLFGYTDDVGNEEYNQKLSEKRAQTVGSYLIEKGVVSSRIAAIGFGEKNPVADNTLEEGRRKNRRVEIKFVSEADKLNFPKP